MGGPVLSRHACRRADAPVDRHPLRVARAGRRVRVGGPGRCGPPQRPARGRHRSDPGQGRSEQASRRGAGHRGLHPPAHAHEPRRSVPVRRTPEALRHPVAGRDDGGRELLRAPVRRRERVRGGRAARRGQAAGVGRRGHGVARARPALVRRAAPAESPARLRRLSRGMLSGQGGTMDFGAAIFLTDYSMGPAELGRALEQRGFGSLWAPEHSHIPLSRRSPFPQGGDLPKKYYDVMDPFVTLAAAAAATQTLKVATGICLVVQRDPIQTAKQVASLDQISGGRFLFGIGAGWNAEEMADHGTEVKSRFHVMQERVEAMKAIWTKSKPEYHGRFVDFLPMMTWPKPVQKPHPPVIVGGAFPHGARRAIAFGDGWVPHARRPAYGDVLGLLPEFRKMATEAGRDPATLPITIFGVPEDGDLIKRYRDAGVARLVFNLPPAKADEVLPVLDRRAALMR